MGSPFSTLSALGMLHELGVTDSHEAVRGGLALVLDADLRGLYHPANDRSIETPFV